MSISSVSTATILPASGTTTPIAALNNDALSHVFSQLDPKSIASASGVCKVFYAVTKRPNVWEPRFKQLMPKVTPLTTMTLEKQFKSTYYDRVVIPNREVRQNVIDYIEVLNNAKNLSEQECNNSLFYLYGHLESDKSTSKKLSLIQEIPTKTLEQHTVILAGAKFDGSIESIDPESAIGVYMSDWLNTPVEQVMDITQEYYEELLEVPNEFPLPAESSGDAVNHS